MELLDEIGAGDYSTSERIYQVLYKHKNIAVNARWNLRNNG